MHQRDKCHENDFTRDLCAIERDLNLSPHLKEPIKKWYHKLIKVQKKVIDHVKQCYEICYNEGEETKGEVFPNYILHKNTDFNFPPMPNLNDVEELESDEDEEDYKPSSSKQKMNMRNYRSLNPSQMP